MTSDLAHTARAAVAMDDCRPLYVPSDSDVQQAISVLSAHWNAEWEAGRRDRERRDRERSADWLAHASGCDDRARQYDEMGFADMAQDQRAKAAFARRQAEIATRE